MYKHIENKGKALKLLIINTEAINYIDSSGVYVLKKMIEDLKAKNIKIMFSGTSGPTRDILFKSGIIKMLGKENLFLRSHEAEDYYDGKYNKTAISKKLQNKQKTRVCNSCYFEYLNLVIIL